MQFVRRLYKSQVLYRLYTSFFLVLRLEIFASERLALHIMGVLIPHHTCKDSIVGEGPAAS